MRLERLEPTAPHDPLPPETAPQSGWLTLLTKFMVGDEPGTPRVVPNRARPLPIFGVASWAILALTALTWETVSLLMPEGGDGWPYAIFMLYVILGASAGSIAASTVAIVRRERAIVVAWLSLLIIASIVAWFFVALGLSFLDSSTPLGL